MRLLVRCIGEFFDDDSEGLIMEGGRYIGLFEGFGACYVSPKVGDIGYEVGMRKLFYSNKHTKIWKKEKYVLLVLDWIYEKSGDWLDGSGTIAGIKVEEKEALEELLK